MKALTVHEAKAHLGKIAREVLRSQIPVIVRASGGFIQILPYKYSGKRTALKVGRLDLSPREMELHNTFGDSL
jgi:hypothetical protein